MAGLFDSLGVVGDFRPRPYQAEACEAVFAEWERVDNTLVHLATGLGKTPLIGMVAGRFLATSSQDVLVLAHQTRLVDQAAGELGAVLGFAPDIEMADLWAGSGRVVVASVQTLATPGRMDRWPVDRFGLVVADECFPAGTLVDGRPIETIRVGDTVLAPCVETGRMIRRRVTHVFRRPVGSSLVTVEAGGRPVVSTPCHPFARVRGGAVEWVAAGELNPGDFILQGVGGGLSELRGDVPSEPKAGTGDAGRPAGLLFGAVREGGAEPGTFREDGSDEPEARIGPDEGAKPDAVGVRPGKGVAGDGRSLPRGAGWQRQPDAGAGSDAGGRVGVADRNRGQDRQAPGERLPDVLQAGHWQRGNAGRCRGGRGQSQAVEAAGGGQEEGGTFGVVRVDRITVHERGRSAEFGRLCGDGHVYNLEVEGEHTYTANGFVVHNCHHYIKGVPSYMAAIERFAAAKKLGVTATPSRHDRKKLGQTWQSVAYSKGIDDAVSEAYLVPVDQQLVTILGLDLSHVRTRRGDLDPAQLSEVLTREKSVVYQMAAAIEQHCKGEPAIIFTAPRPPGDGESQGDLITAALNELRPGCAYYLTGQTKRHQRNRRYKEFAAGRFDRLVGCGLFLEGFNEPTVSRVVMCRPTGSRELYEQMVGRGTRALRGVIDAAGVVTADDRRAAIAASGKPRLLVLDFVGNSGKHKLITAIDLFGGRDSDRAGKVKDKGERKESPKRVRQADGLTDDDAAPGEAVFRAEIRTRTEDVDPFRIDKASRPGRVKAKATDPATPAQLEWLRRFGGVVGRNATIAQAGRAIAEVQARRKAGLCSPKHQEIIDRKGLGQGRTPRTHGRALMDLLASRGWEPLGYPLEREHLGVRRVDRDNPGAGYRLTVRHWHGGRWHVLPVGPAFQTPDDVRAAYLGIVADVAEGVPA